MAKKGKAFEKINYVGEGVCETKCPHIWTIFHQIFVGSTACTERCPHIVGASDSINTNERWVKCSNQRNL